ncbi:MAG: hypothetical protein IKG47_00520 [Oscillospiraceae bacterium]|nr:hypothetical protein [Clostridiales bacterium]MBR3353829.1 hypothetical protein [Oscillospiraceae bacterium]
MAITNSQIIMQEMLMRGITEEIHTFQKWRQLGFSVKKGEKSDIKFPIWKYGGKKQKNDDGEDVVANPHCFMKESAFFKRSQVEPLKAGA